MLKVLILSVLVTYCNAILNITAQNEYSASNETLNNVVSHWMSALFNHHSWDEAYTKNATAKCKKHVLEYVTGLRKGASWANKSEF